MKLSSTIFTLLVTSTDFCGRTWAFAPVLSTGIRGHSSSSLCVVTGPDGKSAPSKEEDLKLTVEIILNHVGSNSDEDTSSDATFSDDADVAKTEKKVKKKKKSPPPAATTFDVGSLDIRVGVITKAWAHEEADKLYCEEIDVGEEAPRSIASGLRAYYSNAEDLVGRRVCVLTNLKTRKLVGYPSHGMVLCASSGGEDGGEEKVVFVDPPKDAAIGERVACEGYDGEPASENQIGKKKILDKVFPDLLTDADGVATYKGVPLTAGSGRCVAQDGLVNAQIS